MPASVAIEPTVCGASPDSTLTSTPCSRRNAIVSRVSGRSSSARTDDSERLQRWRAASGSAGNGAGRRPEGDDAPSGLLMRARLAGQRRRAGTAPARRARTASADAQSAPAPAARETGSARRRARAVQAAPPAIASSVRLRASDDAANRPSASTSSSSATPCAGAHRDDAQPRLGQRPGLVDADRVHRGQRLDRVQLLRKRPDAGHARAPPPHRSTDTSSTSPSGTSVTMPATAVSIACLSPTSCLPEHDDEHGAERHHHGQQHVQQPVDRELERGARMAELAGRARRCRRRSSLRRPPSTSNAPVPSMTNEPDRTSSPAARGDCGATRPSGSTRPAGARRSDAGSRRRRPGRRERAGRGRPRRPPRLQRRWLAVPDDRRPRRDERCERVELALRAQLLPDPDRRVADDDRRGRVHRASLRRPG